MAGAISCHGGIIVIITSIIENIYKRIFKFKKTALWKCKFLSLKFQLDFLIFSNLLFQKHYYYNINKNLPSSKKQINSKFFLVLIFCEFLYL